MYRFRTIAGLLDGFQELENQEIYFASPNELNDPMEGYRDIFWQGDEIIWTNLLIHFLRSIERIYSLLLLVGESQPITIDDLPIYANPYLERKPHFIKIKELFFANNFIKKLPNSLALRNTPIRRGELLSYLNMVFPYALNAVSKVFFDDGVSDKAYFYHDLTEFETHLAGHDLVDLVNRMEVENKSNKVKNLAETLFSVVGLMFNDFKLSGMYDHNDFGKKSNQFFLLTELPERFITRLEDSLYPKWYSASFLRNCTNSAVWAHYGDNHKGACLIFKEIEKDGQLSLLLNTHYGITSSGPMVGFVPHRFHEITYHNKYVEIDFFRSLGRANISQLDFQWYRDENGNKSSCAGHLASDTDTWREQYWVNFFSGLTVKLKEWDYEQEYRLIINGNFHDYSKPKERVLKYSFTDLEGIIFGIKTSATDKVRLIKILEEKCIKENRKDFNVYQAYYSADTGLIEKRKLSGFNFGSSSVK